MDNTLYIALSRQTSLWNQLDMVSNNLANVNTTAYKSVQPHFTEYLSKSKNDERLLPDRLAFVHDFGIVRDYTEGAFSSTENPLDVAIHGDGYFVVDTPEGIRYTRVGQFKLNNDGMLVTANGDAVLDDRDRPIFFAPEETRIDINRDGTIATGNGVIARFRLVRFADGQRLRTTHDGMYRTTEGNPPLEAEDAQLEQGMIEKSNVNAVVEMAEMIKLQRAYENVQMMIDSENTRRQNMMNVYAKSAK